MAGGEWRERRHTHIHKSEMKMKALLITLKKVKVLVTELCPTLRDPNNFIRLSHHKGPRIVLFHLSEMSRIGKSVCVLSHSVGSHSLRPHGL